MAGKCEHGLTTKECFVCASPKHGGAAKTNAERQREFRQRKADTEATEVRGIFAHPDDHAEVKEAAAKIARRRQRATKRLTAPNTCGL